MKSPGPGKEFPKRKAGKRSETTFFADKICALSDDDQSPDLVESDSEDDEPVVVVDDSPVASQKLST